MAEVTVSELATSVNVSVEHLLTQMKEAGLTHVRADQVVSDEDKQTLLAHLRSSHGEEADAPKRITLKRRTITKLKTGTTGRRVVNVEIRKKRTYVKREDELGEGGADLEAEGVELEEAELAAAEAAAEESIEEAAQPESEIPETVQAEVEEAAAPAPAPLAVVAPAPVAPPAQEQPRQDKRLIDPELLRQAAAARRKEKEAGEKARKEALARAKKLKEEEEARRRAEPAAAPRAEPSSTRPPGPGAPKPGGPKPANKDARPGKAKRRDEGPDDDKPKKKGGKSAWERERDALLRPTAVPLSEADLE
ncbi:MAG: translation initiation factor IF-2 N-terminal domain-containing protein, partial [Gammaproteobacteria bacterium]